MEQYAAIADAVEELGGVHGTSATLATLEYGVAVVTRFRDFYHPELPFSWGLYLSVAEKELIRRQWHELRAYVQPQPPGSEIFLGQQEGVTRGGFPAIREVKLPSVSRLAQIEASVKREYAKLNREWRQGASVIGDADKPPRQLVKKDSKTEARNKWIYDQCCKGIPHDKIVAELRTRATRRGWKIVSTKQRIQQIGNEYADDHGLDRPPPRQQL
jgi:hypothetical protein